MHIWFVFISSFVTPLPWPSWWYLCFSAWLLPQTWRWHHFHFFSVRKTKNFNPWGWGLFFLQDCFRDANVFSNFKIKIVQQLNVFLKILINILKTSLHRLCRNTQKKVMLSCKKKQPTIMNLCFSFCKWKSSSTVSSSTFFFRAMKWHDGEWDLCSFLKKKSDNKEIYHTFTGNFRS